MPDAPNDRSAEGSSNTGAGSYSYGEPPAELLRAREVLYEGRWPRRDRDFSEPVHHTSAAATDARPQTPADHRPLVTGKYVESWNLAPPREFEPAPREFEPAPREFEPAPRELQPTPRHGRPTPPAGHDTVVVPPPSPVPAVPVVPAVPAVHRPPTRDDRPAEHRRAIPSDVELGGLPYGGPPPGLPGSAARKHGVAAPRTRRLPPAHYRQAKPAHDLARPKRTSPGIAALLIPITLAAFITSLDNTVVNVALPSIQKSLLLSTTNLEWVATSYILSFAGLLLGAGKLVDRYGRKPVLVVGLLVFVIASVGAGLAQSGDFLIVMRILQGVGGALVMPATLALIATDLPEDKRQLGTGLWTGAIALALALGPLVGGAISEYLTWSWIFYINVPIVAFTLWCCTRFESSAPVGPVERLDLAGLISSGVALTALTWALTEGSGKGWGSGEIVSAFALAGLMFLLFALVERDSKNPMIDPAIFRSRVFTGGAIGQVLWGLGINGVFFFTSIFLQDVLDFSPTAAGATFLPLALSLILTVPLSAKLVDVIGAHWTVFIGLVMISYGLWHNGHVGVGGHFSDLLVGLLAIGIGSALTTPMTTAVLTVLPERQAGLASGVMSTAREISGVFGIVVTGVFVISRQNHLLDQGVSHDRAFTSGYLLGMNVAAALMLVAAVVACAALWPQKPSRHGALLTDDPRRADLRAADVPEGHARELHAPQPHAPQDREPDRP